eukprot:NODE_204_length_1204_cov_8.885714_g163_i0.p6 GENE.NODE_204_length_1204_cov_8.885714_g163_i0~~NODE_204_length_1204_cov_8.885714_g163_i0.p6  ORF type:complete len:61 (-),score=2.28 NODE_204_length_1204_cov_8.885714_g163_i0:786-968(-)
MSSFHCNIMFFLSQCEPTGGPRWMDGMPSMVPGECGAQATCVLYCCFRVPIVHLGCVPGG